jgi:hypothetical protein
VSASLIQRVDEPLDHLPCLPPLARTDMARTHARTHAAWLVCCVVVSVSCRACRSCRACHVMIHSCRLRHPVLQRQRPRRRGLGLTSGHGWMRALRCVAAADAMRASPVGSSALCLLLLACLSGERAIAIPLHRITTGTAHPAEACCPLPSCCRNRCRRRRPPSRLLY